MSFNDTYGNPMGRTSRGHFIAGLIVLALVTVFYYHFVKGRNGEWVLATLLFPWTVLCARRLQDMGVTPLLLAVPVALIVATVGMHFYKPEFAQLYPLSLAAAAVSALTVLWCLVGKGKTAA
jgi:uncharacterized membrane protein YhaH (DUF805 family)